jgi:hypothetical protein
LTRSFEVLEPPFETKRRIVGRVRLTQKVGVVAELPVGRESEWESEREFAK